jgi:exopolysaccharide biosynthesis polyprenyl glycosylphosphotransferase
VAVGLSERESSSTLEGALLTFIAFLLGALVFRRERQLSSLLPLTGALLPLAPAACGLIALEVLMLATGVPSVSSWELLAAAALVVVPAVAGRRLLHRERCLRTAVIGLPHSAGMLGRELELAGVTRYTVVGVITPDAEAQRTGPDLTDLPILGTLEELGPLVEGHRIDLLLMSGSVSRLAVFDEMARSCLHLPVRLWELTGFYEEVFGHVPVAEINASWFQYIMHPRFNAGAGFTKRALDLVVGSLVALPGLPLIALLGLLVSRDGGPAFFKQTRIGEGGEPFTVYKLRTMREGTEASAQWAAAEDPRVTPLGRVLRKTHLDELPQLMNVLRGDMSLVGPRPEQPAFVDRLEATIPFYSRRHLVRPGVTGWAQVRCGYAGSDLGSAWKLCHDLYYLKHRSLSLDLAIIAETVRTLVADRQYGIEPSGVSFIMRAESPDALKPHVAASA